ncbi:Lrp/AsnC family transcriptional regulator [Pseudonocardia petroleophila]|uniref:Lrp/AsnC family transcriptional regulator n=1 Tax=Pseudonocardia petroleophila TaxID=37331 RepID=A0A7G7MB83_9PSEU|nr:Lrp/AsnC family transcriptional regulator [Pseudonocardia petroleophila]QNG50044.1 Lrp/AsnC family transcriptional regulator [Pseudonocardia petroleophila]
MAGPLAVLDRRIVGALQVDGRAPWERIAAALGEPEGTVARHGLALLADGGVQVIGVPAPEAGTVVHLRCGPGQERVAALALARRRDTRWAHLLAGPAGGVAEIGCPPERLARLVGDELPRLPGLVDATADTVLRYVRTEDEWRPGLLAPEECEALTEHLPPPGDAPFGETKELGPTDRMLLTALQFDARRGDDELAEVTGLSRSAVPRRVDRLRRDGRLRIRVVVDPARLGFGLRAVVRASAAPRDVAAVAAGLRREPWVLRACRTTGDRPLLAEVAVPGVDALHDLTTDAPWLDRVTALDTAVVVGTVKDGGLFAPPPD